MTACGTGAPRATMPRKKQAWNAFVYYTEAEQLLKPVTFVSSSHLEVLDGERGKAATAGTFKRHRSHAAAGRRSPGA